MGILKNAMTKAGPYRLTKLVLLLAKPCSQEIVKYKKEEYQGNAQKASKKPSAQASSVMCLATHPPIPTVNHQSVHCFACPPDP